MASSSTMRQQDDDFRENDRHDETDESVSWHMHVNGDITLTLVGHGTSPEEGRQNNPKVER